MTRPARQHATHGDGSTDRRVAPSSSAGPGEQGWELEADGEPRFAQHSPLTPHLTRPSSTPEQSLHSPAHDQSGSALPRDPRRGGNAATTELHGMEQKHDAVGSSSSASGKPGTHPPSKE
jgi:hypothetical protein